MPIKSLIRTIVVFLVATVAAYGGYRVALETFSSDNKIDQRIFSTVVEQVDVQGETQSATIADFESPFYLINFWATWCPPCREEIPLFNNMQKKYGKQKIQFIGISVDDNYQLVQEFQNKVPIDYPVLMTNPTIDAIHDSLNPQGGIPFSVIVNAKGRIIEQLLGVYSEEQITELLTDILE